MKPICKYILLLFVLLMVLPVTVSAAEDSDDLVCVPTEVELFPDLRRPKPAAAKSIRLMSAGDSYENIKNQIIDAVKQQKNIAYFDSRDFRGMSSSEGFNYLKKAFNNAFYTDPEAMAFIDRSKVLFYNWGSDWWFEVSYREDLLRNRVLFEQRIDDACKMCFSDQMTDLEKIVVAHDWIVSSCQYDPCVSNNVNSFTAEDGTVYTKNDRVYSAYGVFVDHNAVCNGYALAFQVLMNHAGINCCVANNDTHAWNLVQLDNKWYHIDTTWDDPVSDVPGRAYHHYMLKSDNTFENPPFLLSAHTGWTTEYGYICESDYSHDGFSSLEDAPVFLYKDRLYAVSSLLDGENKLCEFPLGCEFSADKVQRSISDGFGLYTRVVLDRKHGLILSSEPTYYPSYFSWGTRINYVQINLPEWKVVHYKDVESYDPYDPYGLMISNDKICLRKDYSNYFEFDLPEPELFSTDSNMPLALMYEPDLNLKTLVGSSIHVAQTGQKPIEKYSVYCACYRDDGKMLSVTPISVENGCFTVSVLPHQNIHTVKFFVNNPNFQPLSSTLTVTA